MHAAPLSPSVLPWPVAALVSHLWQSTLFGVVILALLAAGRGLPAGTRRNLAWMGLVKFVVPAAAFAPLIDGLRTLILILPRPLVVPADLLRRAGAPGLWLVLLGVWIAAAAALFFSWLGHGRRVRRRVLGGAGTASEAVERELGAAAERTRLWPIPQCLAVANAEAAGVLGAFSPVVVIPRSLEETLSTPELRAILIHECVHDRRSDNFWNAVQAALVSLFWFDPVVWLLGRSIGLETEKACDEAVLQVTADPGTYLQAIVKSVRHSLGLPPPGYAAAAAAPVLARLQRIGDFQSGAGPAGRGTGVLLVAAAMMVFCGYAGSFGPVPVRPQDALGSAPATAWPGAGREPRFAAVAKTDAIMLVAATSETYDSAELDHPPVATWQEPPCYPLALRRAHVSGTVVVDATVTPAGMVEGAFAADSTEPEFEGAAIYAFSHWQFRPGTKNGAAVRTHLRVPIAFVWDENSEVIAPGRPR